MAINKKYTLSYRRKKLGLTDYRVRLRLIKSKKTRLVVRKYINSIIVQLVNYNPKGDLVLRSINSKILKHYGWNYNPCNLPSAYLLGLIIGLEAKKLNIKEAVFDIGLNASVKGSLLYSLLKGALDSGLIVPHDKIILPSEDRIKGKHIEDYYFTLSKEGAINKQFSKYLKNDSNPADITKNFEEVKLKILSEYKND